MTPGQGSDQFRSTNVSLDSYSLTMSFKILNKTCKEITSFMKRHRISAEIQSLIESYAGYSEIPKSLEIMLDILVENMDMRMKIVGDLNHLVCTISAGDHAEIKGRALRFHIWVNVGNVIISVEDGAIGQRWNTYTHFARKTVVEWAQPDIRKAVFIKGLMIYYRGNNCRACGKLIVHDKSNLCESCQVIINEEECTYCASHIGRLQKGRGWKKGTFYHAECNRCK